MAFTPKLPAGDLQSAIGNYLQDALDTFNVAFENAHKDKPTDPDPKVNAKKQADWAIEVATARAQMTSALQQIVQADTMLSERRGRMGYDALVRLMEKTETAADDAYIKLNNLTDDIDPSDVVQKRIALLNDMLQALARLAPVSVWQKAPSSSTGT